MAEAAKLPGDHYAAPLLVHFCHRLAPLSMQCSLIHIRGSLLFSACSNVAVASGGSLGFHFMIPSYHSPSSLLRYWICH